MRTLSVVELDPFAGTRLGFRPGLPGMQVDAFIFQAPPEPFDKDVIEEPALAIHRDAHTGSTRPICPSARRELAALVGVHDFGRAEPGDGLIQRLDAEVSFQRV